MHGSLGMQVGGLGDVVTGLARACLARGHNVEVMLPFYESLQEDKIQYLQHDRDFDCPKVCMCSWTSGSAIAPLAMLFMGLAMQ